MTARPFRFAPIAASAALALGLSACTAADYGSATSGEWPAMVQVPAISSDGAEIGVVRFEQMPEGVRITTSLGGIPSGEHGFHIHETGVCDASSGFKSAGGHFQGTHAAHGMVDGGPHAGDMPNQTVGADGLLVTTVEAKKVTMFAGRDNSLFDADGSALVIHAKADDYKSQPSGDAGSRIACAVIAAPTGG